MGLAGKYYFGALSFLLLLFFILVSWDAPVSGDEYVHYRQAEKNLRYFRSLGKDTSAFDTPVSHLKYYGQSFDNLTAWLIEAFDVENIIRFRHVSNALAGWLLVFFAGIFAARLAGDNRAGMLAMVLLAVSPRFTGHVLNNLKDIPFALGYTASLYFIFRYLEDQKNAGARIITGLILSMAFTISVRIGGVLVLCYLWLFWGLRVYQGILAGKVSGSPGKFVINRGAVLLVITITSWFTGLACWPWAWNNPWLHPVQALIQIHHYPTTLRQLFEGKLYWSELFPWYYLPKYILITVPLVVLAGLAAYIIRFRYFLKDDRFIFHIFLAVAAGFPVVYAIMTGANVYGGWRQFLFIYPPLVIMASLGIFAVAVVSKNKYLRRVFIIALGLLCLWPLKYMAVEYPYFYIYFNPLTGGTKKAYGNYEMDYYFTAFKEAYEWIDMNVQNKDQPVRVATNFLIPWYYEFASADIKPVYFDYYMRGNFDWDYAVVPGTFLSPFQLKKRIWPPENTVYKAEVCDVPVCAVIKRRQWDDLKGYEALRHGNYDEAKDYLLKALSLEPDNETALLNLARVYFYENEYINSERIISELLNIYPGNEWAIDLLGEIHFAEGDTEGAVKLWKRNIDGNYKFFHSYINLSKAFMEKGMDKKALSVLFDCLRINPFYKPVLTAIGNWYTMHGEEEVARKYFGQASKIDK